MEFPDGVEIEDSGTFRVDDWEKYVGFFKLKAQRELDRERERVRVLREALDAIAESDPDESSGRLRDIANEALATTEDAK